MKNSNLTYTPHIDSNFGYQPKYLGRISNYRSVQEVPTYEIEEELTPLQFTPQEEISETINDITPEITFTPTKYTPKKGAEWGHRQFVQFYRQSGAPENEMDFGSRIAQDESGFTPGIVGSNEKYGVEALGYFQMLTKYNFKPMNIAGTYSGVDAQTFLNNPIIQIQAAQNMKNSIMNQFTANDLAVARSKGYTDSALVAGAGAGGVGGVRNWIHYGKNSVDVNVKDGKNSKRKGECSVAGRMEALNGYFKNGGILRFQDGGINEAKDGYSDWIDRRRDIYKSNYNDNHFLPSIGAQASNLALHNMNLTTVSIDPSKVPDGADGVYRPLNRTIALNEDNPEYAVHEFAHSTRPVDQVKKIDDIKDGHSNLFLNSSTQEDTYTDDSEEMYARFMSLRYMLEKMGINMNRTFTPKDVQDLLNMFTKKLILKTPNGSSTFSTDGKLLKSGIKGNINPGESSIERDIDYRIRDTIGRYNLNVSAEILSNVASIEKKLPRLGRLGMKFEDPNKYRQLISDHLQSNNTSYIYRMNTDPNYRPTLYYTQVGNNKYAIFPEDESVNINGKGYDMPRSYNGPDVQLDDLSDYLIVDNPNDAMYITKNAASLLPNYNAFDTKYNISDFKNANEVYNFILGLENSNPYIASGLTAVFAQESGLDHNVVSSKGARGIAQLLGNRYNEYKKWLGNKPDTGQNQITGVGDKVNNGNDDGQIYYDALKHKVDNNLRMSEKESRDGRLMQNSKYVNYSFDNWRNTAFGLTDPAQIAELFTGTFERPGNSEAHIDKRRGYALSAYNLFNK